VIVRLRTITESKDPESADPSTEAAGCSHTKPIVIALEGYGFSQANTDKTRLTPRRTCPERSRSGTKKLHAAVSTHDTRPTITHPAVVNWPFPATRMPLALKPTHAGRIRIRVRLQPYRQSALRILGL
jgi:hypothetical protein